MPSAPARAGRPERVGISELDAFDEIIDARSPGEYAEDRIPGAINLPVLDNAERAEVGTLHQQASPFAARSSNRSIITSDCRVTRRPRWPSARPPPCRSTPP